MTKLPCLECGEPVECSVVKEVTWSDEAFAWCKCKKIGYQITKDTEYVSFNTPRHGGYEAYTKGYIKSLKLVP